MSISGHVSIPTSIAHSGITCPICLGVITSCMTVKECMHRFCQECINTALRLGQKECPSCRVHCPTRRSLREDLEFDALVAVLVPDISTMEKKAEEVANSYLASTSHKAFAKSVQKKVRAQNEAREAYGDDPFMIEDVTSLVQVDNVPLESRSGQELGIILQRHPRETKLGPRIRQHVFTYRTASIGHIKEFLRVRYSLSEEKYKNLELHIQMPNSRVLTVLDPCTTLFEIERSMWGSRKHLILYFSISGPFAVPPAPAAQPASNPVQKPVQPASSVGVKRPIGYQSPPVISRRVPEHANMPQPLRRTTPVPVSVYSNQPLKREHAVAQPVTHAYSYSHSPQIDPSSAYAYHSPSHTGYTYPPQVYSQSMPMQNQYHQQSYPTHQQYSGQQPSYSSQQRGYVSPQHGYSPQQAYYYQQQGQPQYPRGYDPRTGTPYTGFPPPPPSNQGYHSHNGGRQ